MEAFESFVAIALEAKGFVVSAPVRFPVRMQTREASSAEVQTHGYEVDDITRWLASAEEAQVGGVDAEHQRCTDLKRWSGSTEATLRAASR